MNDQRSGAGFRYLEHTADLVVQAWGDSRAEVLRQVILATAALVIDPGEVAARGPLFETEVEAPDAVSAMVRAVNEYLYLLDTEGLLVADVVVADQSTAGELVCLTISFRGQSISGRAHEHSLCSPPKAATYHGAKLCYDGSLKLWVARLILDL